MTLMLPHALRHSFYFLPFLFMVVPIFKAGQCKNHPLQFCLTDYCNHRQIYCRESSAIEMFLTSFQFQKTWERVERDTEYVFIAGHNVTFGAKSAHRMETSSGCRTRAWFLLSSLDVPCNSFSGKQIIVVPHLFAFETAPAVSCK